MRGIAVRAANLTGNLGFKGAAINRLKRFVVLGFILFKNYLVVSRRFFLPGGGSLRGASSSASKFL